MNTFYSILYCPIRPLVDERLSIALFVKDRDKVYFRYSHDKLKIVKELLPDSAFKLLRAYLNNLENYFCNNEVDDSNLFFSLEELKASSLDSFVSVRYFDYLSRYTNNLLHFSKPKILNPEINEEGFDALYVKFIYNYDTIVEKRMTFQQKVTKNVNPRIQEHVNLNIELTSKDIKNLVIPTEVWFIGKNEVEVTGEVFDFNKSTYHLENDISKYLNLVRSIDGLHQPGTHFIVGNEPKKELAVNHSIWREIRKLETLTYVAPGETGVISEYMEKHEVSPFILEP